MEKKAEKKKARIGDIVARVDKSLSERFEQSAKLRSECYQILSTCSAMDRSAWDDTMKEYSLAKDLQYKIDRPSGEIIVIGYVSPLPE